MATAHTRLYTEDRAEAVALEQFHRGQNNATDAARLLRELLDNVFVNTPQPTGPTRTLPGTAGKLAVMQARAGTGLALFHPADPRREVGAVCNSVARDGHHLPNGSDPLRVLVAVNEHDWSTAEEIEAAELAAEWERYDEVAAYYLAPRRKVAA